MNITGFSFITVIQGPLHNDTLVPGSVEQTGTAGSTSHFYKGEKAESQTAGMRSWPMDTSGNNEK